MNKEEYKKLLNSENRIITADDLQDKSDRTLLYGYGYGYGLDRTTHHTYIKDGEIISVMYEYYQNPVKVNVMSNTNYIPAKRTYPEASDYEFCKLLKDRGYDRHSLNFLPFNEEKEEKQFYGKILGE